MRRACRRCVWPGAAPTLAALALLAAASRAPAGARGGAEHRVERLEPIGAFGATTALGPGSLVALAADDRLAAASQGDEVLRVWRPAAEAPAEAVRWRGERLSALAVDEAGERVAGGSESGAVAVWSAAALDRPPRLFERHRGEVRAIAFGGGGRWLLTGAENGVVSLHETATGRLLRAFAGPGGPVRALRILEDGRLAVGSEQGLAVYQARGRRVRALARPGLRGAAFGPSGAVALLWDEEGRVARVDLAADPPTSTELAGGQAIAGFVDSGEPGLSLVRRTSVDAETPGAWRVAVERWRPGEALPGRIGADTVEASSASIVASHAILGSPAGVRVWHLGQPPPAAGGGHAGAVEALAVSPDGRRLLSAGRDGTARLWDVESRRALATLRLARVEVRAACFAASGRTAAVADVAGRVRVVDALDGHALAAFDGQRGLEQLAFASEAPLQIASASYDRMVLREVGAAAETGSSRFPRVATGLAFAGDGRTAVVALGPDLQLREVPGGKTLWTARDKARWFVAVALAPDGARVASWSRPRLEDGPAQVAVWDARSGRRLQAWSAPRAQGAPRLALAGAHLAALAGEQIVVYDSGSGREVARRAVGDLGERGTALGAIGEEFVVGTSHGRVLQFAVRQSAEAPAVGAGRPRPQ